MNIAAIIVNYRTPHLALECLNALKQERRDRLHLKAIVVDNSSCDGSVSVLSAALEESEFRDWVEFLPLPINGGFGWANNQAILHVLQSQPKPEAFFLVNPDAAIERGALEALVVALNEHPNVGAVGSQLLNSDGSCAGSAFRFPTIAREFVRGVGIGRIGQALGVSPIVMPFGMKGAVDWVTGASVLLRTKALEEAGLFDTGFFLYFEEVELMHRLSRKGWAAFHCPESRVFHLAGASTGVVDGKADGSRVPPDYVFHSRRRYFALTGGKSQAFLANVAWLAGDLLRRIIEKTVRRSAQNGGSERSVLLRLGLRAEGNDTLAAFDCVNDKCGGRPAWMRH